MDNTTKTAEILRMWRAGNDAPNNIAAALGVPHATVLAVIEQDRQAQIDADIIANYKSIGDIDHLARKHSVSKMRVYGAIHSSNLAREHARAAEYAQAVMATGDVVYALPARHLKTSVGADAIISALENTINKYGRTANVVIAVAVIPVDEFTGTVAADPLDQPKTIAAHVHASAVNHARKAGAAS